MKNFIFAVLLIVICSCKKPYNPPIKATSTNYLVVEGVINAGADSTIIKLSRTVNLSSGVTVNAEPGAAVSVMSDAGASFSLTEIMPGTYAVPALNLDATKKYRLSIKTSNNQQYLSDAVAVSNTPLIDSIGFIVQPKGLQLYVNTHDPANATHYYRWDYTETWQFHAEYQSEFITNGTAIVPRTNAQQIYTCFSNDNSSNILLGSSAKLAQDVIYQNILTSVPATSEKLETKYSILVHQYALTGDAYNFWVNLKKITEQLGSIFDAEPSQINGNIHNVSNPAEPVIGYISACVVQSKRVFISNLQLPDSWIAAYPYNCGVDSDWFADPRISAPGNNEVLQDLIPLDSPTIPITSFYNKGPKLLGYLGSDIQCVDCTIRGTKLTPPFWK